MLCLLPLLILLEASSGTSTNFGTTLFHNKLSKTECWSQDDLVQLKARKMFQGIALPQVTPDQINSRYIKDVLRYYREALRSVDMLIDQYNKGRSLKEALADTIGGHLRHELLPTVRFAYYAGYIPYRSARDLHDFLDSMKSYLNTQGLGWRAPRKVPQWSNLTVVKILIGSGRLFDPCAYLVTKRDTNSCIHLPPPKLDDIHEPSAVALPFKTGGLVSLASPHSENVLLQYYTTASRCILHSSPKNCRHTDFVNFNNELWHWMKRDVAPHLVDERLFGAFGGVLRIAAAVQNYGIGLSKRNLFEFHEGISKWHPWQALTQSYLYINADWTPTLYIGLVIVAALTICLLQIIYTYIFGDATGCHCRSKNPKTNEQTVFNVECSYPDMNRDHSSVRSSNKNRNKVHSSPTKSTVRTQRVYDLNENSEKLIDVILSENEDTDTDSPSLSKQEESDVDNVLNLGQSKNLKSPPQLQTPITQLRIEKSLGKRTLMYSTSTGTHSEATYGLEQQMSESVWSGSGSSSSDRSVSTESSRIPSRKALPTRDVAWARRVVSKQTIQSQTKSTTGQSTEFDMTSFTTPPSQR